jgi:hypothetical protein
MFNKLIKYFKTFWRTYVLILTPLLLLPIILSGMTDHETGSPDSLDGLNLTKTLNIGSVPGRNSDYEAMVCAYVLLLMAIYW